MMHEDEIRDISSAMAQLGAVRSDVVEKLCTDFMDNIGTAGSLIGSFESTESLLMKTLPREPHSFTARLKKLLDAATRPRPSGWHQIPI